MKNTRIYVVTHKKADIQQYHLDPAYKLIRVGNYGKEADTGLLSDRTGIQIADKNPNYCELTAMYWMWKNDHDSEIIGLCHYRRYFTKSAWSDSSDYFLTAQDIEQILHEYDAVIPEKEFCYRGAYAGYLDCGREKDLITTKQAIQELYPDYVPFYESEFEYSAGNYPANMIITSKKHFDAYSKWLFDILGYVEERTDLTGYTPAEARIYGYISERLLGVWLAKQQLKVKCMRIVNTEDALSIVTKAVKTAGVYQLAKRTVYQAKYRNNKENSR